MPAGDWPPDRRETLPGTSRCCSSPPHRASRPSRSHRTSSRLERPRGLPDPRGFALRRGRLSDRTTGTAGRARCSGSHLPAARFAHLRSWSQGRRGGRVVGVFIEPLGSPIDRHIAQQGANIATLHARWDSRAAHRQHGRGKIDVQHHLIASRSTQRDRQARIVDYQRNPDRLFVHDPLARQSVSDAQGAVVRGENHNGVVVQSEFFQGGQDLPRMAESIPVISR